MDARIVSCTAEHIKKSERKSGEQLHLSVEDNSYELPSFKMHEEENGKNKRPFR